MKYAYVPAFLIVAVVGSMLIWMINRPAPPDYSIRLPLKAPPIEITVSMLSAEKVPIPDEHYAQHSWNVVQSHWSELRACIDERRAGKRNFIYGDFRLSFLITESGRAEDIYATGVGAQDRILVACCEDRVRYWHFNLPSEEKRIHWDINWDRAGR